MAAAPSLLEVPRRTGPLTLAALAFSLAAPAAGLAQSSALGSPVIQGDGQTIRSPQLERELDYGTGANRGGSLLDTANPIDLMNKLRRATALDDATQPGDAVDAALRDFHSQKAAPGVASPAAKVKAP
ncbi:MAG: hypothetical protein VKI39_01030 [Synechococcus sp.]|nr:hypothetical protein [Synechococcus sp.]